MGFKVGDEVTLKSQVKLKQLGLSTDSKVYLTKVRNTKYFEDEIFITKIKVNEEHGIHVVDSRGFHRQFSPIELVFKGFAIDEVYHGNF